MAGINMAQLTGTGSAKASSAARTSAPASSKEASKTDFANMIQNRVKESNVEETENDTQVKSQKDLVGSTDKATGEADQTVGKQEATENLVKAEAKPAEAKPAEAKPAEAKPAEAEPAEAKPAETKPGKAEEMIAAGAMAEIQAALSQMMVQNLGTTEELTEELTASVQQLQAVTQGKVLEELQEAAAGSQKEDNSQIAVDQEAMADEVTGSIKNFESVTAFPTAASEDSIRTAKESTEEKPVRAVETLAAQVQQTAADDGIQKLAAEVSGDSRRQENGEKNSQSQEGLVSIQELMASSMTRGTPTENFASVEMPREETVTVPTTPETFPQDVGNRLAASLPRTDGTLTIELEPASLGRMTIKVVYEAGRAAVSIISANPKTVELLSQNAGEIARILEERTGQITEVYTPDPRQSLEDGQAGQEHQRHRQENPEKKKHDQTESFTQMLRLGLV